MSDLIVSWIRTIVPVIVGGLLTRAADKWGIVDIDGEATIAVVSGLVVAVYYALARFLEQRYPVAGYLLGSRKAPTYTGTQDTPPL